MYIINKMSILTNCPYVITTKYLSTNKQDYGVQQLEVLIIQILQECTKFLLTKPKFDIKIFSVEQLEKFMKKHNPYKVMVFNDNEWINITPKATELHKKIHSNDNLNINYNKNLDNKTKLNHIVEYDTGLDIWGKYQFRLIKMVPNHMKPDYFEEIHIYINYVKVLKLSYIVNVNKLSSNDNNKNKIEIDEIIQKQYIDKKLMVKMMLFNSWISDVLQYKNTLNLILSHINKQINKCDFNGIEDGDYVL